MTQHSHPEAGQTGGRRRSGWLSVPAPRPPRDPETVRHRYPRLRTQVFLGIFIGYAAYYLIRNNVPLVASILEAEYGFSTFGLGLITNAALLSYGFSKFLTAIISDRSNARWFLPIGLVLSAIANIVLALSSALSVTVALFAVIMIFNGLFQGMGWPPSGRVVVHWFSTNERGSKMAIWNLAHNVGGAGAGLLAAASISAFGQWQAAFWAPSIVCVVLAVVAFLLIRDNPPSQGLPPIAEYRNNPDKVETTEAEDSESTWERVRKHVLTNRTMINLALANVFVYTLRYGVLVWAPIYLVQVRGADLGAGIAGFSVFELAGIPGTLLCGWVSDKVFKGRRSPAGVLFLVGVGLAVLLYWLPARDEPLWLAYTALVLIGGLIYGPVMLIGLQALDLSPKHVAGTAAGFTGLFGYALGATLASSGVGFIVQRFGWDQAFIFILVCVALGILFLMLVNTDETRLAERARRRAEREDTAG